MAGPEGLAVAGTLAPWSKNVLDGSRALEFAGCIYIYIFIYLSIFVYISTYVYIFIYIYIYIYIYLYVNI